MQQLAHNFKLSASFTCVSRACGRSALGGRPGVTAAASAAAGEVAPRIERDDPLFENWMYLEGPCGVWSDAQRDGTDEGLTKEIVRAAGCVHPPSPSSHRPSIAQTDRRQPCPQPSTTRISRRPLEMTTSVNTTAIQAFTTTTHNHSPSAPPNRPQYKRAVWNRLPLRLPLNSRNSLHHSALTTTQNHHSPPPPPVTGMRGQGGHIATYGTTT
jgi:hypothetical protein